MSRLSVCMSWQMRVSSKRSASGVSANNSFINSLEASLSGYTMARAAIPNSSERVKIHPRFRLRSASMTWKSAFVCCRQQGRSAFYDSYIDRHLHHSLCKPENTQPVSADEVREEVSVSLVGK